MTDWSTLVFLYFGLGTQRETYPRVRDQLMEDRELNRSDVYELLDDYDAVVEVYRRVMREQKPDA